MFIHLTQSKQSQLLPTLPPGTPNSKTRQPSLCQSYFILCSEDDCTTAANDFSTFSVERLKKKKGTVTVLIPFSWGRLVNQICLRSRKSFRKWTPWCTNPDISSYFALISCLQTSSSRLLNTDGLRCSAGTSLTRHSINVLALKIRKEHAGEFKDSLQLKMA